jgi:hypothetical protein
MHVPKPVLAIRFRLHGDRERWRDEVLALAMIEDEIAKAVQIPSRS